MGLTSSIHQRPTATTTSSNNNDDDDNNVVDEFKSIRTRRPEDVLNIPNDSELNPPRYTQHLKRCFCHGDYWQAGCNEHVIFVAFLDYDNGEFVQPGSMSSTAFVPWNWLATVFGQTTIMHVQLVFVDTERSEFYTISADMDRGVHCMCRKTFRRGWRFLCLTVTEEQELAIYNFLVAQLEKPFARLGIIGLYTQPVDSGGMSWFCSSLVVEALQAGGLLTNWLRPSFTVPPHELHEYLTSGSFTDTHCIQLKNNPVLANARRKSGR